VIKYSLSGEREMKSSKINNCSWFDSENARLIILCATLGVFGVHKFAQRKNFQGVLYILLDLTIIGIILTVILAWLDLIFLTAKSDNRPGNMMLGAAFILLESLVLITGSSRVVIKTMNPVLPDSTNTVISIEAEEGVTPESKDLNQISVDEAVVFEESVEQNNNSEIQTESVPVVEENVKEEPVVQKAPVAPKAQPKKINEMETSADDVQYNEEDDFDEFSLYDMVTGSK
jgi:TM2 domain-containing membrane protein YozV